MTKNIAAQLGLTNDNVELDINGATWLGMRVAGWTWEEDAFSPDQLPSENSIRLYASHWSTGPHNAERLYRESDIAALLSKLRAPVADERAAQEYGSPADVAQRIEQYLAQDGRMNSGTQLLYEAMKALRASQGDRNDG